MITKRFKKRLKVKKKAARPEQNRRVKKKIKKVKKPMKVLIHPIKSRKAVVSPKAKLFDRVKTKNKRSRFIKKLSKLSVKLRREKNKKIRIIKSRNKVIRKKHKIIEKENTSVFPAEAFFKAKIKVVGIGGGGGSIVSEIGRSLNKATFVIADTDIRALKKKAGIKYFWFGKEFTHGLGTGVNPEIAKTAAESEKEKIIDLFRDQDIIILIASLGGGLGSGATKVFAEAAKKFGGIILGIFTLPFKFEGKNKSKIALKALKELKSFLNVSITIPNEKIFKIISDNTSITDAFSSVNKSLIESLESLIDLIYNPGLINIDFADLRTILNCDGNSAFLNTVQASGKDRVKETIEKIFINPLYQNNNFLAENILFNISSGNNLNMFEVEKISQSIAKFNPKAKIIFGISKNKKLKNKIKTTILMTGPQKTSRSAEKIIEKIKVAEKIKNKTEKQSNSVVSRAAKAKSSRQQKISMRQAEIIKKSPSETLSNNNFVPTFNKEQVTAETSGKLITTDSVNVGIKKLPAGPFRRNFSPVSTRLGETGEASRHGTIRRNALEIKKAEALEQDKRILQEEEWEVPAFLRRVKPSAK